MKTRRVLVVGLGRFGQSIVEALWQSGAEVIAVDERAEAVDAVKHITSAAFVGDATQARVLEGVGAREVDVAVVTVGEHFEPTVLCVASLVKMGVPEVIARAATDRQADILTAVGAKRVVQIEGEMGRRLGTELTMPLAQELMDLAGEFRVVPWEAHGPLVGRTLAASEIRRKYRLNVLGVRRGDPSRKARAERPRVEQPVPDYVIADGDTLLLVGDARDLARFVSEVGS